MAWDMNIGVIPDENTSLRCVLNHLSPIHHPHNRNPPPIYPHRRFLAILRDVWNKTLQKDMSLVNTCAFFFLGGSLEESWSSFLHWHRLSPLHVWFSQELVRLIALINPVKVLNNIIHPKSLKKFLGPLFDRLSSKNANVLDFQGLYKHICLL